MVLSSDVCSSDLDAGTRILNRTYRGNALALNGAGDVLRGQRRSCGGKDRLYRADLFGERAGPGDDIFGQHGGGLAQIERLCDRGLVVRSLDFRAQPAAQSLGLFGKIGRASGRERVCKEV